MAIFYVLQDPTSSRFLSDLKLGYWDGYYNPDTDQVAECAKYRTRKAAFIARDKAKKLLMLEDPNDSEESCEVWVLEVRTQVVKKILHTIRTL